MKVKIIRIGNSQGIMLSKQLINQYSMYNEVELVAKKEGILLKPAIPAPRTGWEERFAEAAKQDKQPDNAMLEGFNNEFDEKEWQW